MSNELTVQQPQDQQIAQEGEVRVFSNQFDIAGMAVTVGTLKTTPDERAILFAPIKDEEIAVRPDDGILYVPHIFYTKRWTLAWSSEWGLLPQGMPSVVNQDAKGNGQIVWGFHLIVKGKYLGFAMGGQRYIASNPKMSYDDSIEGAKSNSIMRLGKGIGMYSELWDPGWREPWATNNVELFDSTNWKGEKVKAYRRKEPESVKPMTDDQRAYLIERWMTKNTCNVNGALVGLNAFWNKQFKCEFWTGKMLQAKKVIETIVAQDEKAAEKTANTTAPVIEPAAVVTPNLPGEDAPF